MKKKETVTFLINSLNIGGSEKVCVTLSNELIKKGFNVNLIVVNPSTPLEEKLHIKVNIIKPHMIVFLKKMLLRTMAKLKFMLKT